MHIVTRSGVGSHLDLARSSFRTEHKVRKDGVWRWQRSRLQRRCGFSFYVLFVLYVFPISLGPSMRRHQILIRSDRHDARRIDRLVALIVVLLDVVEVHGLGDARNLVQVA